MSASTLRCPACGTRLPPGTIALRCPMAGTGGGDHVLVPVLEDAEWPTGGEPNPFVRYRRLLHAYAAWRAGGRSDAEWVDLVGRLDDEVAVVAGRGFRITPLLAAGDVLAKDETGNVGGSHKARHLFGTLLGLAAMGHLDDDRPLAIASCGNAALAAAILARAAGRALDVFVPDWADTGVVAELTGLGARVERCPRLEGMAGDPSVHRFRGAVAQGAVPFSCQGTDNALALDGGRTIGWELADQAGDLDRVVVQVGGGALASCTFRALDEAVAMGRLSGLPILHAVQAMGAAPLERAWRVLSELAGDPGWPSALATAATERDRFMWPWGSEPKSMATGILDDEAYDWLAVVSAVARSGGSVVAVAEHVIGAAMGEARGWVPAVGPTGAAGLAGLRALQTAGVALRGERAAVLLTGRT
jgi:threonine synthase